MLAQTKYPAPVMEGNRYTWYGPQGDKFVEIKEPSGTFYREGTPRKVIDVLESCMGTQKRVRLFLGDKDTGRNWMDEFDVAGYVNRSMGPVKKPLLISSQRSTGGGAILVNCIVRLLVDGREVYRHPTFNMPEIEIRATSDLPEYKAEAWTDGTIHARFKTLKSANRWKEFMNGNRMGK